MRLVTVAEGSRPVLGFTVGDTPYTFRAAIEVMGGWLPLRAEFGSAAPPREAFDEIHALIESGDEGWMAADRLIERFASALRSGDIKLPPAGPLLAPIPRPRKNIVCVGRNYAEHTREQGAEPPGDPVFFTKAPTTVATPDAEIPYPAQTEKFDYEGELAVVIGRRGRNIAAAEAHRYIFGYTIVNDLTARELQKRHQQWFKGKSLDGTCPMGPVLITRDELEEGEPLQIETRVNGEIRQSASTAQMIFDIPTLISVLSDGITLEPGDVIATGTPSGVGAATGSFLSPGDRVSITVSRIGTLTNVIGGRVNSEATAIQKEGRA